MSNSLQRILAYFTFLMIVYAIIDMSFAPDFYLSNVKWRGNSTMAGFFAVFYHFFTIERRQ